MEGPRCSYCNHLYDLGEHYAKVLDCNHTVCLKCIGDTKDPQDKIKVKCPEDNIEYKLKIEDLKSNDAIEKLLKANGPVVYCKSHPKEKV